MTGINQENPKVVHHYHHVSNASPGIAMLLEVLPGIFFQTFGIGNIYAGNVGLGLILMFSYWVLAAVNFVLLFVLIGFVSWPLTFVFYLIFSAISAQSAAQKSIEIKTELAGG
ncbi:MAG: hypothetical protein AAF558_13195 [Verrucomicrobiota bacterium]